MDLGFQHQILQPPDAPHTLLLLHGTGGSEYDLLPLGQTLSPQANLLSPRGKVLENGMPRFFRRLQEGVFDVDDLKSRTQELAAFVREAMQGYSLEGKPIYAVGYSNGANIASSLLLLHPALLSGAILLRPMVPYEPDFRPHLHHVPVFLGAGSHDTIATPGQVGHLAHLLQGLDATVTLHNSPAGHELVQSDIDAARQWLQKVTVPGAAD